jgi:hypothetical protein
MFSPEFANQLKQATMQMQQEPAESPAVQHLTEVLRVLWREVERLERSVSVTSNQIVLKTGGASIVMKADGTILIQGRDITIEGSGNVTVKASNRVALKGSQVVQN